MNRALLVFLICIFPFFGFAQRFSLESSLVKFYSHAPVEDITALNTQANSIIDLSTGDLVFFVPIRGFQFEKALMQEHFNENYLEAHKYPAATFTAVVADWMPFEGEKEVLVSGMLSVHGIQKKVDITGKMDIDKKSVTIDAVFLVKIADYKIKVPKALFYNIAETIEVTVHFAYKPLKQ